MGYVRGLAEHAAELHPRLLRALDALDTGTAVGVDWQTLVHDMGLAHDGAVFAIDQAYRTAAEQDEDYARTVDGVPVTLCKGGQSYHQWGLAVDLHLCAYGVGTGKVKGVVRDFSKPQVYRDLGIVQAMAAYGISWLGDDAALGYDVEHWELRISHPNNVELEGTAWWKTEDTVSLAKIDFPVVPYSSKRRSLVPLALVVSGAFALAYFLRKRTDKVVLA